MRPQPDTDVTALAEVSHHLAGAADRIGDDHRSLPTPCDDWDLTALVDHMTGGNWFTARILTSLSADDALAETMDAFSERSATGDQFVASLAEQQAGFEAAGVLDRSWSHVAGQLPGREILRIRLHDLIVHSWDVHRSIYRSASLPAALAEWGLAELRAPGSLTREHFGIESGPSSMPADDDLSSTYLALFGRDPGWLPG